MTKKLFITIVSLFITFCVNAPGDIFKDVELMYLKDLKSIAVGESCFQIWGDDTKTLIPKQKIKNLIELKFRTSGIDVFDRSITLERGGADLSIDFKHLALNSQYGVLYISLKIYETAHIERNNLYASGRTWERWAMLSYSKNPDCEKELMNLINDLMDEFSNLYLSANPRKFISEEDK